MSSDYDLSLDRSADEVSEPKLYPDGTWKLRCVGTFFRKDNDDHDVVNFIYIGKEPMTNEDGDLLDVDAGELEEAGNDYDGNRLFKKFTIETKRDQFDLKKHIAMHGVDVNNTHSLKELAKECRGYEIAGYLGRRSYESGGVTKTDNTVKSFFPIDGGVEQKQAA